MSRNIISRLSQRERFLIEKKLKEGKTYSQIAREINRSKSTISREINKSVKTGGQYCCSEAEDKNGKRKFAKIKKLQKSNLKLLKDINLFNEVFDLLKKGYSPMIISKRHLKNKISHECIYKMIYYLAGDKKSNNADAYQCLYHQRKKRKKQGEKEGKGLIPDRTSIHKRIGGLKGNTHFRGHFELDLIEIVKGKRFIISVIERKTKRVFFKLIENKKAKTVCEGVLELLKDYEGKIRSITTDNGLEFYEHQKIAQELNTKVYFCDAYSSWQKGMVENSNKLFRMMVCKFFPKVEYGSIDQSTIKAVQERLNLYPRKCLNFKSAFEVFYKKSVALTC